MANSGVKTIETPIICLINNFTIMITPQNKRLITTFLVALLLATFPAMAMTDIIETRGQKLKYTFSGGTLTEMDGNISYDQSGKNVRNSQDFVFETDRGATITVKGENAGSSVKKGGNYWIMASYQVFDANNKAITKKSQKNEKNSTVGFNAPLPDGAAKAVVELSFKRADVTIFLTATFKVKNSKSSSDNSSNSSAKSQRSRLSISGEKGGHKYVDLGLSVLWARCNVGAAYPEDSGKYFCWGEGQGNKSKPYKQEYCSTYDKPIGDIKGHSVYDAATVNWKNGWRMPTREEMKELINKCKWQWDQVNGKKGFLVTGPNGNSIFLPAAGCMYPAGLGEVNTQGYYWTSTPYTKHDRSSYRLHIGFEDRKPFFSSSYGLRFRGHTIRAVLKKK